MKPALKLKVYGGGLLVLLFLNVGAFSQNVQYYQAFDIFEMKGDKLQKEPGIKKSVTTAAVYTTDSIISELNIFFPRVGAFKAITVKLQNMAQAEQTSFLGNTGIFAPAFMRANNYRGYTRDMIFRLDKQRLLIYSVPGRDPDETGSYKLITKVADTIFYQFVQPFSDSSDCLFNLHGSCFKLKYRNSAGDIVDHNYLEKWFVDDNRVVREIHEPDSKVSKQYFKLIGVSLFYSFLYRYPLYEK